MCLQWRVYPFWGIDDIAASIEKAADIHHLALRVVQRPGPSFVVCHYVLPHAPFVYTREGANPALEKETLLGATPNQENGLPPPLAQRLVDRYAGNLHYLDTLIGELMQALQSTGNFENSMIILTSDHSWRRDPALNDLCAAHGVPSGKLATLEPPHPAITHVPLIVKYPRQKRPAEVHEPVRLTDLHAKILGTISVR